MTPKQFVKDIIIAFPKDADARPDRGESVAQGSRHVSGAPTKRRGEGGTIRRVTLKDTPDRAQGCY